MEKENGNTEKSNLIYLFENLLKIDFTHTGGSGVLEIDVSDMPKELKDEIENCTDESFYLKADEYLSKTYDDAMALEFSFVRGKPLGNNHLWKKIFGVGNPTSILVSAFCQRLIGMLSAI